jgi:hypothetical protein
MICDVKNRKDKQFNFHAESDQHILMKIRKTLPKDMTKDLN